MTSLRRQVRPVGYEIVLLYLGGLAMLAIGGPCRLSLETVLRRQTR
ncbi:hypothetical protein [Mesorhizobium sp. B4-1-1]|nr:hypothetical protein [Mesorhizobium sp. B4-1-1]